MGTLVLLVEGLPYVHRNRRLIRGGGPRRSPPTFTQLLGSDFGVTLFSTVGNTLQWLSQPAHLNAVSSRNRTDLGNVLTNATKHKETIIHERFRQKLLLRVQEDRQRKKKEAKKEDKQKGAAVKKLFFFFFFKHQLLLVCPLLPSSFADSFRR